MLRNKKMAISKYRESLNDLLQHEEDLSGII